MDIEYYELINLNYIFLFKLKLQVGVSEFRTACPQT